MVAACPELPPGALSSLVWPAVERFNTAAGVVGEFLKSGPDGKSSENAPSLVPVLGSDAMLETFEHARQLETLVQSGRSAAGIHAPVQNIPRDCTSVFAMKLVAAAASSHTLGDAYVTNRRGIDLGAQGIRTIDFGLSWFQLGSKGAPHQVGFLLLALPGDGQAMAVPTAAFEKTYTLDLKFSSWGLGKPKVLSVATEPCKLAA